MTQAAAKKKIFDSRYEILSIVGRGSRSVVYHTTTTTEPIEHIALKVLTNKDGDKSATEQLRKEALAMVASRHKYSIRLDDFHSIGQISYLAMEYAPHGDLRKYMAQQKGLLPILQAERFLLQMSEALAFMHSAGILHRDIKPDNILIINDRQARLADFGVAILPGEHTNIEELQKGVGTMDYMAPEVLEGIECTKRSDVYLLGVTFYEVLTGVHPFADIPLIEVITRRQTENITPPRLLRDEMPQYLEDVIMRAIEFDPAKRFESADELFKALSRHSAEDTTTKRTADTSPSSSLDSDPDELDLDALLDELAEDLEKEQNERKEGQKNTAKDLESIYANLSGERAKPKTGKKRKKLKSSTKLRSQSAAKPMATLSKPKIISQPKQNAESKNEEKSEIFKGFEQIEKKLSPETDKQATQNTQNIPYQPSGSAPKSMENNPSSVAALFGESESSKQTKQQAPNDYLRTNEEPSKTFKKQSNKSSANDYQDLYRARDKDKTKGRFKFILFAVLAVWLLDVGLKHFTDRGITDHAAQLSTVTETQTLFPAVASSTLTFPDLPAGLYSGYIIGLTNKNEIPLLISRAINSNELVVTLGLSGWTPAKFNISESREGIIRVRSGGFILTFEGLAQEQFISGKFTNSISGEEGTWSVTPIE